VPKKNEKKKSVPPVKTGGTKKKFKKKNRPITSACDGWTRVGHRFSPAVSNGGNGEKDKKKKPKMKVGHFGNFFSKGVRLEFFFGNRVRKKKFLTCCSYPLSSFFSLHCF